MGAAISSLARVLGAALLLPASLAGGALCVALLAAFTLSGVGPVLHRLCAASDARLLACALAPAPGAHVRLLPVNGAKAARLAVRWTPAEGTTLPPVVVPNGLGATLVTISALHERLAALGFSVLSYDRAGVGMSDARAAEKGHAGAAETVADMRAVMHACAPAGTRWLLVGPSMGSIVAQCYIAAHPEDVAGFLNMDGLPFPFAAERSKFAWAAVVYRVYASLVWTGCLRLAFFLARAKLLPLASAAFSPQLVRAQMNERRFLASLASEMHTMMDCADAARAAWGPAFDLNALAPDKLAALAGAAPAACGDAACTVAGFTWSDLPRSAEEPGGADAAAVPASEAFARVLAPALAAHDAAHAPLSATWQRLAVRVMSARNYDFGMGPVGDWFYSRRMRDWAGAEHALHALLARSGTRTVFPSRSHGDMFFGLEAFIADQVLLLAQDVK